MAADRDRDAGHGHVAPGEDQGHRDHGVGIGAQPAEEAEVLDEDPGGQAEDRPDDHADPDHTEVAAQEGRAHPDQQDHDDEVDQPPVPGLERAEGPDPRCEDRRLGHLGHLADHGGEGARGGRGVGPPGPGAPTGPGLQDAHADEERAHAPQEALAEAGRLPRRLGQGHQRPGHHVEQHAAGRPEQPAAAVAEDAAEGLAEHPDHQTPAHTDRPGRPGPVARGAPPAGRSRYPPGSTPWPPPP